MRRYARKLTLCLLTLWQMGLTPKSPCFADWKLVPENYTTTEPGYFGTLQDGKDTLAAIQTHRKTSERWKAAYSDLRTEFWTTTEDIKRQMTELEKQLGGERKAWKAEIERNRTRNILLLVIVGGLGYAAGR
jgi:hypothetical protein